MTITDHLLHRSRRAALPHLAPTFGMPRQAVVGVHVTSSRSRKPSTRETAPCEARRLATTTKYRVPNAPERAAKHHHQARPVPGSAVIADVLEQDRAQIGGLLRNGRVQTPPEREADLVQLRSPSLEHRPAPHRKPSRRRLVAAVRRAEEGEGLGFTVATPAPATLGVPTELDKARLLGMQRQAEPRETFNQLDERALSFLAVLKSEDKIIRDTADDHVAARPRLTLSLTPEVEDVVQRLRCAMWDGTRPAGAIPNRSYVLPGLEAFLATIPVATRTSLGSSLKFCRVAEGSADLYPRFGPAMLWAAGDCVLRCSHPCHDAAPFFLPSAPPWRRALRPRVAGPRAQCPWA